MARQSGALLSSHALVGCEKFDSGLFVCGNSCRPLPLAFKTSALWFLDVVLLASRLNKVSLLWRLFPAKTNSRSLMPTVTRPIHRSSHRRRAGSVLHNRALRNLDTSAKIFGDASWAQRASDLRGRSTLIPILENKKCSQGGSKNILRQINPYVVHP